MNFSTKSHRRSFLQKSLAGTVAIGAATPFIATLLNSFSAEAGSLSNRSHIDAANEKEFRQGVNGPATLSLITSQIAVDRATNINTKEFAGFELEEAKSVTSVLKDLGTKELPMDAKSTATLNKIKSAEKGIDFDKAYIEAQLENHEHLRDLALNYLKNTSGSTPAENQGKHLAMLALATFKEHVAITKRILGELNS